MADPQPHKDGWEKKDGKWYFYKNGQMVIDDWVRYKGERYWMGSDGAMVTGWQKVKDIDYYFYPDGHMARDEWISGKFLDMNGMQTYKNKGAWRSDDKGKWWEDASGWYPKNRTVLINKKNYSFNAEGYLIT